MREDIRASGSKKQQRHRAAAQLQVLPQKIRQVNPPHSLGKPENPLLSIIKLSLDSMAVAMVVILVGVMVGMLVMIAMAVAYAGD